VPSLINCTHPLRFSGFESVRSCDRLVPSPSELYLSQLVPQSSEHLEVCTGLLGYSRMGGLEEG
jgi:hypothetical protein